jgi:putative NADH-flavin reductase
MEGTMKLTIIAATGGVGRELLAQAVAAGHDVTAVVRNPDKLSRQVRAVATGVRRIVVVSAAPVSTVPSPGRPNPPRHDPGDGFFMRYLFSKIASARFGKVYDDLARMEDLLAGSGLDWTVVRPPQLTDKPLTGAYRTAYGQNLRGGLSVPRADVAHLMLRVLGQPETIHQTIGIAS